MRFSQFACGFNSILSLSTFYGKQFPTTVVTQLKTGFSTLSFHLTISIYYEFESRQGHYITIAENRLFNHNFIKWPWQDSHQQCHNYKTRIPSFQAGIQSHNVRVEMIIAPVCRSRMQAEVTETTVRLHNILIVPRLE